MSQESDCSTCSQLSISQETLDLMWRSVSDVTNICNYTQIAARDPIQSTDLSFPDTNGDTTLLKDNFQVTRGRSTSGIQHAAETCPLRTEQDLVYSKTNSSVVLDYSQSSNVLQSININTMQPLLAFLPNVSYEGVFNFEMSLPAQSKETKAVDWTYSELLRKVYVRYGQSCPFRFRTSVNPPPGTVLRAMPIYLRTQHIQEVVKRCPHHAANTQPDNIGVMAPADHLVRCDHKLSRYEQNAHTGFHSVVMPYENPIAAGVDWTICLYQFMCFSSCIGGLNRRPVQIVFSLECLDGSVLGRQSMEVRICACPGRDRHNDEKNLPAQSCTSVDYNGKPSATSEIMTVTLRRRMEDDEVFTLLFHGRETSEVVHHLRDLLEIASAIPHTQLEKLKRQLEELRQSQTGNSVQSVLCSNTDSPSSNVSANCAVAESSSCLRRMPQQRPSSVHEVAQTSIDSVPYDGVFNFELSLSAQSKETKAVEWTYSELLRKVYVRFGQSCPFRFRTSVIPPPGTVLRAMPIYIREQNVREVVKRCPHHAANTQPDNLGVMAPADHLVRCDHKLSRYEQDTHTGFHSVVTPYEHPIAAGVDWSVYLYQFMCFSSCIGGLNRRPVQIIFLLESLDGNVLGRQSIEVRICACPGRDRQNDEKNCQALSSTSLDQIDHTEKPSVTSEIVSVGLPAKRRRVEDNNKNLNGASDRIDQPVANDPDDVYTLSVRGRENFEILHRLREMTSAIPQPRFENLRTQHEELRHSQTGNCVQSALRCNTGSSSFNVSTSSAVAETSSRLHGMQQRPISANIKSEGIMQTSIDSWLVRCGLSSCSMAFHRNNLISTDQLQCLSLEELEKFGLSDDVLAAVWLAVSRDRRLRRVCKDEDNGAQVTVIPKVSLTANNQLIQSSITTDSDRQINSTFEVPRGYKHKRKLSLPKENGFKDC